MLCGSLYEPPAGASICPYHYEYGDEERLLVVDGPAARHPRGEEELGPGDVVCFPPGPEGAHEVTNGAESTVRVLILSTRHSPPVAVYPDSGKIGVWPGGDRAGIVLRRGSAVDCWDGEA